ncbi:MAG: hypothetical protein RLY31_1679 [Bacteroidota bacterium]|jgi:hypothetical protein
MAQIEPRGIRPDSLLTQKSGREVAAQMMVSEIIRHEPLLPDAGSTKVETTLSVPNPGNFPVRGTASVW